MEVHHVGIIVKDLDKSIDFYKRNFELKEIKRFVTFDKKKEVAFLESGNIQVELMQVFDSECALGPDHISFKVDDLDKTYADFKSRGIEVSEPQPAEICKKKAKMKDPDGNMIQLLE